MRVATEEFFSVMHSCCCLTGLGLGLNILVLFPSLAVGIWFQLCGAAEEKHDVQSRFLSW